MSKAFQAGQTERVIKGLRALRNSSDLEQWVQARSCLDEAIILVASITSQAPELPDSKAILDAFGVVWVRQTDRMWRHENGELWDSDKLVRQESRAPFTALGSLKDHGEQICHFLETDTSWPRSISKLIRRGCHCDGFDDRLSVAAVETPKNGETK